jgi:hypothetical protein
VAYGRGGGADPYLAGAGGLYLLRAHLRGARGDDPQGAGFEDIGRGGLRRRFGSQRAPFGYPTWASRTRSTP